MRSINRKPALILLAVSGALGASAPAATADPTPTPSADLATTVSGAAFFGGASATVTVTNNGPSAAQNVTVTDTWRAGSAFTKFQGMGRPAGVSCTTVASIATGTATCSMPSLGSGQSTVLHLALGFYPFTGRGTLFDSATAGSATPDPNSANNTASVIAIT
jgi:hypothetical protein